MPFHAWDAATLKRVHVYIEKTMEKQPVNNYYCMSDISCLHYGDKLLFVFTEHL